MLDSSPHFQMIELDEVVSTNTFLRDYRPVTPAALTLVTAEYQSAGRGQADNSWESERGQNLLFSLLARPSALPPASIFVISEAIALSLREALLQFIAPTSVADSTSTSVTVKWPNDIYVGGRKIAGILIENSFAGNSIAHCIIGCGVNINQQHFRFPTLATLRRNGTPSCPTPVSLVQLLGHNTERQIVLDAIITAFRQRYDAIQSGNAQAIAAIHADYLAALYRRTGLHPYRDANGSFHAEIADVEPTGHLILRDEAGNLRRYAFKEVEYLPCT